MCIYLASFHVCIGDAKLGSAQTKRPIRSVHPQPSLAKCVHFSYFYFSILNPGTLNPKPLNP